MDLAPLLLTRGYDAVAQDRRARCGTPARDDYPSRLAGRPALVVRSREGARLFYDEALTERAGAVPPPLARLLFGAGAVHGLDGAAHRRRKQLLVELLSADTLHPAVDTAVDRLRRGLADLDDRPRPLADLHDLLVRAYGEGALRWAGIGLPRAVGDDVARCLDRVVDGFGFAGRAYPRGWQARLAADRWARGLVARVRSGEVDATPGTPLHRLAASDLGTATAGTELLDLLRPTVAVARLATFAALRLGADRVLRDDVAHGDPALTLSFAQEVRRTSPFVPLLAARARREVVHEGHLLPRGGRVVLDVVGIHGDVGRWGDPERFEPGRFLQRPPRAFDVVAQGGGHPSGHRCPGESVALRLLAETAVVLARTRTVATGTGTDLTRIPTLPSGWVVRLSARAGAGTGSTRARGRAG